MTHSLAETSDVHVGLVVGNALGDVPFLVDKPSDWPCLDKVSKDIFRLNIEIGLSVDPSSRGTPGRSPYETASVERETGQRVKSKVEYVLADLTRLYRVQTVLLEANFLVRASGWGRLSTLVELRAKLTDRTTVGLPEFIRPSPCIAPISN